MPQQGALGGGSCLGAWAWPCLAVSFITATSEVTRARHLAVGTVGRKGGSIPAGPPTYLGGEHELGSAQPSWGSQEGPVAPQPVRCAEVRRSLSAPEHLLAWLGGGASTGDAGHGGGQS